MKNTPSGSSAKKAKKYVFFDELTFLIPLNQNEVDESLSESVLSPPESSQNTESNNNISVSVDNDVIPSSSNVLQDLQGKSSTAKSENSWTKKRKNRPRQSSQESSEFEKGLLTLLASQTPDIASDDLSFFSSLGPILKTFDLEQKRILNVVTAVKNMHHRPCRSNSMVNVTSPEMTSPPQYEPPTPYYDYEATTRHPGYQTASTFYADNDHSSENVEHV